jgi:hypothetical protein
MSNFSWYVLNMVDDTPGDSNRQPLAGEEIERLLRDVLAASKRINEDSSEQRRQNASLMKKIDSLQQAGLTEEGKKARIAPGKLCFSVLKRLDMRSLLVGGEFCCIRGIWLDLQYPPVFPSKGRVCLGDACQCLVKHAACSFSTLSLYLHSLC